MHKLNLGRNKAPTGSTTSFFNRNREINREVTNEVKEERVYPSSTHSSLFSFSSSKQEKIETSCLLFPSYAVRSYDGPESDWILKVKGRAFTKFKPTRTNKVALGVIRRIAGVAKDCEEYRSLEQRVGLFLDDNSLNLNMSVEVVGLTSPGPMVLDGTKEVSDEPDSFSTEQLNHKPEPTNSSASSFSWSQNNSTQSSINSTSSQRSQVSIKKGHFDSTIRLSDKAVQMWNRASPKGHPKKTLILQAFHSPMVPPSFGQIQLIEPRGISVISDIDDTIKDSGVFRGKKAVLTATFLHECKEVPGMAEVYKYWWLQGASFHYVSNSPWQLFPMLETFFKTFAFPLGSAHLKLWDMKAQNVLYYEPMAAKRASILNLLKDFPHRKFILVGDSGEMDLELYTSIARQFPNQVLKIFIRDVNFGQNSYDSQSSSSTRQNSISGNSSHPKTPDSENKLTNFGFDSSEKLLRSLLNLELNAKQEIVADPPTVPRTESPEQEDPIDFIPSLGIGEGTHPSRSSSFPPKSPTSNHHPKQNSISLDSVSGPPNYRPSNIKHKFQARVIEATKGLPSNLVTVFNTSTTLLECPIVKEHLTKFPDNFNM